MRSTVKLSSRFKYSWKVLEDHKIAKEIPKNYFMMSPNKRFLPFTARVSSNDRMSWCTFQILFFYSVNLKILIITKRTKFKKKLFIWKTFKLNRTKIF